MRTLDGRLVKASELSEKFDCSFHGLDKEIQGVSSIYTPVSGTLAFARDGVDVNAQLNFLENNGILISNEKIEQFSKGCLLLSEDPEYTFSQVVRFLFDYENLMRDAFILVTSSEDIKLRKVKDHFSKFGITIGANSIIQPGVVLGPNVSIGKNCLIKSGSVIGAPGFGSFSARNGNNCHMPHIGGVFIGDHVEIGALTTVCAGTIEPTRIEDYAHIDDHVHLAHNVQVGTSATITASCIISGGVNMGAGCWVGVGSTIRDGLRICENVFIGMGSLVTKNLTQPGQYFGRPARFVK